MHQLNIAMLSIHSSPVGELGTENTGGMSVYLLELSKEIGKQGHSIDIFTAQTHLQSQKIISLDQNIRVICLPIQSLKPLSKLELFDRLPDIFSSIEEFRGSQDIQYDLIHSHYWLSGVVGNYARRKWDVPHITTFHTLAACKNLTKSGQPDPDLRVRYENEIARTADLIIVACQREKENVRLHCQVNPSKIKVIPCGVNFDLFRPESKELSIQKLGLQKKKHYILYVGRFSPVKGLERLIFALSLLKDDRELQLLIVGGDGEASPETQKLLTLAKELNVQHMLSPLGRVEQANLASYYNAADLLVVPSYYESFCLVVLEALACGAPVVATRVGAADSIILEGKTGFVVDDNSPELLARGVQNFFASPMYRSLDRDLLRSSIFNYSWPNIGKMIVEQYNSLVREYQRGRKLSN